MCTSDRPGTTRRQLCKQAAGALALTPFLPIAAGRWPASTAAAFEGKVGGDPATQTFRHPLYTREGIDPPFKQLMKDKVFPVGENSDAGVTGSKIDVNNKRVERGPTSDNPVPQDIHLHTICNSLIRRKDFDKWTRWYQEDGNTQVFRMFKDEHNVRNDRPDAGRIESFCADLEFKRSDQWHQWEGTYTIVQPHSCMIFQTKNSENDWAVSIGMNNDGDIKINHRRHQKDEFIAEKMVGKPFVLTVRDNGHDYEVYYNRRKAGEGFYDRPTGVTTFRWGMYGKTFKHDAMLFVTGAAFE